MSRHDFSDFELGSKPFTTVKRERFAHFRVGNMDPIEAYTKSGYSPNDLSGKSLAAEPLIVERVEYLAKQLSEKEVAEVMKQDYSKPPAPVGKVNPTSLKDPSLTTKASSREAVLQDVRRERFAVNLSMGMSQIEAYVKAGFSRNAGAASKLAKSTLIIERIQKIMADYGDDNLITKDYSDIEYNEDWACQNLNELLTSAKGAQDFKEARACINDILAIKGIGEKNRIAGAKSKVGKPQQALPAPVNLHVLGDNVNISSDGKTLAIENLPSNLKDVN